MFSQNGTFEGHDRLLSVNPPFWIGSVELVGDFLRYTDHNIGFASAQAQDGEVPNQRTYGNISQNSHMSTSRNDVPTAVSKAVETGQATSPVNLNSIVRIWKKNM